MSAFGPKLRDTLIPSTTWALSCRNNTSTPKLSGSSARFWSARRETLGIDHPDTLPHLYNEGFVLNELGRADEAEALIRQSLELHRRILGPEHPGTLVAASKLGEILQAHGRLDESEALLRPCLEAQRRVLGAENSRTKQTAQRFDALLKKRTSRPRRSPQPLESGRWASESKERPRIRSAFPRSCPLIPRFRTTPKYRFGKDINLVPTL